MSTPNKSVEQMVAALGITAGGVPKVGVDSGAVCDGHLINQKVMLAEEDSFRLLRSVRLLGSVSVDFASWMDEALRGVAHRDHVQLIPGEFNRQYAAACLELVTVAECTLFSPWSKMQGIFMSDGFVRHAEIVGNVIETGSDHKISICAMSGMIAGNVDAKGWPVPVQLNDLRIAGGGLKRVPIKVVSFKDDRDYFEHPKEIVQDGSVVTDDRTSLPDDCICLEDFDLTAYWAATQEVETHVGGDMTKPRGWKPMCEDFYDLALQYGRQVDRAIGVFA